MTASELVSTADPTMYDAKESGRNRYALLDTRDYDVPRTGAQLASGERIAGAFSEDKLVLHAQPIMSLSQGRITGAELLLRMRDDDG